MFVLTACFNGEDTVILTSNVIGLHNTPTPYIIYNFEEACHYRAVFSHYLKRQIDANYLAVEVNVCEVEYIHIEGESWFQYSTRYGIYDIYEGIMIDYESTNRL